MSTLEEAAVLLARMTRTEKAQLLPWAGDGSPYFKLAM